MRKIIKEIDSALGYKNWQSSLDASYEPVPYESSNGVYYYDVVMELFKCQQGLCAFTETRLCAPYQYDASKWICGRYVGPHKFKGNLEHFDSTLKKTTPWKWDNFFMADSDINRIKSTKPVDMILKPDEVGYDEFRLLRYDPEMHIFVANDNNQSLTDSQKTRINKMIILLGLNHATIIDIRKHVINTKRIYVENGFEQWCDNINQFPTAHAMMELMHLKGELMPII